MKKIAVDVALLPPEEIADLAIKLNHELVGPEKNKIILGKKEGEAMPHMTLLMGCVEEGDLMEMGKMGEEISNNISLLELGIYGVDEEIIRKNTLVSSLGIRKIPEIQNFHEKVLREFQNFFRGSASREMFYNPLKVSMEEFSYIDQFPQVAGLAKFYPHFTLGLGKIVKSGVNFPIEFKPARLAICHLGDYYTCRKILWSKELN